MTWTILILAAAIALYVFADKLVKFAGKKTRVGAAYINGTVKIASIMLIVVGLNRFGLGTSYYLTDSN